MQSISLNIAQQRGNYYRNKNTPPPIFTETVSDEAIIENMRNIAIEESHWDNFFQKFAIKPYTLYYEDFDSEAEWQAVIAKTLDFLGAPYELPLSFDVRCARQRDRNSYQIYQKFLKLWTTPYLQQNAPEVVF